MKRQGDDSQEFEISKSMGKSKVDSQTHNQNLAALATLRRDSYRPLAAVKPRINSPIALRPPKNFGELRPRSV